MEKIEISSISNFFPYINKLFNLLKTKYEITRKIKEHIERKNQNKTTPIIENSK